MKVHSGRCRLYPKLRRHSSIFNLPQKKRLSSLSARRRPQRRRDGFNTRRHHLYALISFCRAWTQSGYLTYCAYFTALNYYVGILCTPALAQAAFAHVYVCLFHLSTQIPVHVYTSGETPVHMFPPSVNRDFQRQVDSRRSCTFSQIARPLLVYIRVAEESMSCFTALLRESIRKT